VKLPAIIEEQIAYINERLKKGDITPEQEIEFRKLTLEFVREDSKSKRQLVATRRIDRAVRRKYRRELEAEKNKQDAPPRDPAAASALG